MSDELRRQALARDIARRMQLASFYELRVIDRALLELERSREGAGELRWERRLPTGPGDVDDSVRSVHLVTALPSRGVVETLCTESWPFNDLTERWCNPPIDKRCLACWRRSAGRSRAALVDIAAEIALEDRQRADLHEQARAEMLGAAAKVPVCATCRDTHRMMLRDREVMCTRCPTPCEDCRERTRGFGAGPYCATTPCACACHVTRSSAPVRVLSDDAEAPGEHGGEG